MERLLVLDTDTGEAVNAVTTAGAAKKASAIVRENFIVYY